MLRQFVEKPTRANVRLPLDLLAELDRLAAAAEVSRATLVTRLLREGVRRAGEKEAA